MIPYCTRGKLIIVILLKIENGKVGMAVLKSKRTKSSRIISAYYISSLLFLSEGVILLATSFIH